MESPSGAAPDLLATYSALFEAVELDSVFYRPPSPGTIRTWRDVTPDAFRFSVRVPREITHVDRLRLPSRIRSLAEALQELGPRLGCLLFTTPPSFDCDVERLRRALEAVPAGIPTAWEFRHSSWLACPEVMDILAEYGSTPVISDNLEDTPGIDLLPGGVLGDKWNLPLVYVRFRRERYRPGDLMAWGEMLGDVVRRKNVFAYFRQSEEAAAYVTALQELLIEARNRVGASPLQIADHPSALPPDPDATPAGEGDPTWTVRGDVLP